MTTPANTNQTHMHILFVLGINMRGGAELSMLALAKGLREKGYRVSLAAYGKCVDLVERAGPDIEVLRIMTDRTFAAGVPLYHIIRQTRPDIIVTAMTHTNVVTLIAAAFARTGARVIVTEHGQTALDARFLKKGEGFLLPKLAGLLYAFTDEVVAVSRGLAVFIESIIPLRRKRPVRVIYNPVISMSGPVIAGTPHPWLVEKEPVIIGIGRLEKEKNFTLLVRAFALVAQKRPARLIILGEGSQQSGLQSLAESLGVKDRVLLPGFVSNVNSWLQHASIFVCSSLFEGFGNAIVEAMACGASIVSVDCPHGPAEILEQGRYGKLVPLGNAEAMAAAIIESIERPTDKTILRNRAADFSDTKCFDGYDRLIRNAAAAPRVSFLSTCLGIGKQLYRRIYDVLFHENWMIGWIDQPIENSIDWTICPPVHWIGPRSETRYLADPFVWPGKPDTILCEHFGFDDKIGKLRKLTLNGDVVSEEVPMELPLPGHMSFPFMFEHGGETYLMPESSAARRLTIFRWNKEADGWREFMTPLPNTAAADSILFEHGGNFWIAYTDVDLNPFDNLNLCYAPSLEGPWRPHQNNPVKRDFRTSRCGGTPFRRNGKLYRPAQDCEERYGGAIRIMEITECTPTSFVEKEINLIKPSRGTNPDGLHTLAAYGDKCLVDGKKMMFSPRMVGEKMLRFVRRIM